VREPTTLDSRDRWPDDEEGLAYRIGTTDRTEPRTAAGRGLLDWYAPPDNEHDPERERIGKAILAIEAEAAAPAPLDRDSLAKAIGKHYENHGTTWHFSCSEEIAAEYARLAAGDKGSDR
jgi:hypothetical protein